MMHRTLPALTVLALLAAVASGCWNYRELDELSIVAGVAVDKHEKGYLVTAEIVEVKSTRESKTSSKLVSMHGETIFDAVRNMVSVTGKKLYWSHSKVLIISKEIAESKVLEIIDWFNRDSETRSDIKMIVSREKTAEEILKANVKTEDILSAALENMFKSVQHLGKSPSVMIWEFVQDMDSRSSAATAPLIGIVRTNTGNVLQIMGTAVFRNGKMIGELDGEETKYMLFTKDKIDGGLLIRQSAGNKSGDGPKKGEKSTVSLEIFDSKTRMDFSGQGKSVGVKLQVNPTVAIAEIIGQENVVENEGLGQLKAEAEQSLKDGIESVIRKVQKEFKSDIFGFGTRLHQEKPSLWRQVEGEWGQVFSEMEVSVMPEIEIKNSALLNAPNKVGEK